MTKLKAERELQQSRLMEYQVASEHQEEQKTRMEEEVKELMKRVQEMEGIRQKKDLDAASKVSELGGKVSGIVVYTSILLQQFSIECRKTKTKVITLTNHSRLRQSNEPIRTRSKYM